MLDWIQELKKDFKIIVLIIFALVVFLVLLSSFGPSFVASISAETKLGLGVMFVVVVIGVVFVLQSRRPRFRNEDERRGYYTERGKIIAKKEGGRFFPEQKRRRPASSGDFIRDIEKQPIFKPDTIVKVKKYKKK